jgi:hypothetical protein
MYSISLFDKEATLSMSRYEDRGLIPGVLEEDCFCGSVGVFCVVAPVCGDGGGGGGCVNVEVPSLGDEEA